MKEKLFLGFSTQLNSTLEKDIQFALKNKFNALSIDLSWNQELKFTTKEINLLKDYSARGNKTVFHMPFFIPTNSSIPDVRNGVFNYFKKVIDIAADISSEAITFHSGYVEQIGHLKTNKYLIENILKIVPLAARKKIRLSIENDDQDGNYPLWKEEDIMEVLAKVPPLYFTYDPGHANTSKIEPVQFLEKVIQRIDTIHLHNNTGKDSHNSLDDGSIEYKALLRKISEKEKVIFILELFPYERIIKNKRLFLQMVA